MPSDMMTDKLRGYLGFAARSRNLQSGYNTALFLMAKRKAKLVIISEDAADGTKDKIQSKARSGLVPCVIFGESSELSGITGTGAGMVFTITDDNFAGIIYKEIDRIRSERENS